MDCVQSPKVGSADNSEPLTLEIPDDIPSPLYSMEDVPDVDLTYPDFNCIDSFTDPTDSSGEQGNEGHGGICLPCKVCGDKSSGFHYGVMACEGCKGFFRRSIQKKMEYKCHFSGHCPIERVNRNRCQHCRFRKCLAVGMSKESVRIGRYSKRVKQNNLDEIRKLATRPETAEEREARERRDMEMYTMSQTVMQARNSTSLHDPETLKKLVERRALLLERLREDNTPLIPEGYVKDLTVDQRKNPRVFAWKSFLEAIAPSVRRIVEFAKCLPGFMKIPQRDQMQLLKQAYFEVWMIQVATLTSSDDRCIVFDDNSLFDSRLIDDMEEVKLWQHILEFTAAINALKLTDMETALFTACTIVNSDRGGLCNKSELEPHAELLQECFRRELLRRDPQDTRRFFRIVMRMQLLRSASMLQVESLLRFRMEHPTVSIPPLITELNNNLGVRPKLDIYDMCNGVLENANENVKKRPRDIWEQLPLAKLAKGSGLFNPPKLVCGVPTNLTVTVTPKEEKTEYTSSCTAAKVGGEQVNGHHEVNGFYEEH